MQKKIIDKLGRTFEKLRVSLNASCNFACIYCVSGESAKLLQKVNSGLNYLEYVSIITNLHKILNLKQVRLTGGEPTLYPQLIPLIVELKKFIPEVTLTTNGYLLGNLVSSLQKAQIDSINVSLDSLDEKTFSQMSRGKKLYKTLNSIEKLLEYKIPFKLNTTVIKGYNDNQILSLLEFAGQRDVPIRFIEFMKMGELSHYSSSWFFSEEEILSVIQTKYKIFPQEYQSSSTARYWKTESGYVFGIIANESSPFCSSCNRLRLDHKGNLYGCLSSPLGISILNQHQDSKVLTKILENSLQLKQTQKFKGSSLIMRQIGG